MSGPTTSQRELEVHNPARAAELRRSVNSRGPLFVYVGNFEDYQGVDLLLDSFHRLRTGGTEASLAVIGGTQNQIARLRKIAGRAGMGRDAYFPGACSLADAAAWQAAADVLVSARLRGPPAAVRRQPETWRRTWPGSWRGRRS